MSNCRLLIIAAVALVPVQAIAADLPMVAIGLPFAPDTPKPVATSHPLHRDVAVAEIEGLPATLKSSKFNFVAAAKRETVNAALRESFRQMNLLADGTVGRKRLQVTWLGSRTPFRIGASNTATVTMQHQLYRNDTGAMLFDRTITTSAERRRCGCVRARQRHFTSGDCCKFCLGSKLHRQGQFRQRTQRLRTNSSIRCLR